MKIPFISRQNIAELVGQTITIRYQKQTLTGIVSTPNNIDFEFEYALDAKKENSEWQCKMTLRDRDLIYIGKNKYMLAECKAVSARLQYKTS